MSSGRGANPVVVAAFQSALLQQAAVALVILVVMAVTWRALLRAELRRAVQGAGEPAGSWPGAAALMGEPAGRRLLRAGFGLLWLLDGLLQAQPDMPLGMPAGVLGPASSTSPGWARHVVEVGATIWSAHPVVASAAVVWVQVGIGAWLLVAPRGTWSRLAGVAAAGWGALVWVFGEAFGGIFAPGPSWLFGAPGAALAYVLAGVLLAMPEQRWTSARTGRAVLALLGCFFVGMAVLQAWPGRGFWQGRSPRNGAPGSIAAMAHQMAKAPQPRLLSSFVSSFGHFDAAHGFAVNLFVVVALAVLGAALVAGRTRAAPWALAGCWALCLADWVLVQDLGFLGGLGTDPNSMVPVALLVTGGYLGLTRPAQPREALAPVTVAGPVPPGSTRLAARWVAFRRDPGYLLRSVLALGAVGIVLLGAVPLAVASVQPRPAVPERTARVPSATARGSGISPPG
jgi:hypothetical protein